MTKIEKVLAKYLHPREGEQTTIKEDLQEALCEQTLTIDTLIAIIREACEEQKKLCAEKYECTFSQSDYGTDVYITNKSIKNCPNIADQ